MEISLPQTSRMKRTPLYSDKGNVFFGIWKAPNIKMDGDEKEYQIPSHFAGSLDLIAHQEYGNSSLWWAIALVNKMKHPPEDSIAGKKIKIPKYINIQAALLADK